MADSTGQERTALVLAGGGSLGAVQVGMLKALVRYGFVPDLVVGASVGAINGAYYAAEPNREGVARLERIWKRLTRRGIFPFSPVTGLLSLVGRTSHLVAATPLRSLIESELPCSSLEETRIPCHVVATDVLNGAEVVFSSGPAPPALLASAAIPAVFPNVLIDGRFLMDGGVANNTPISTALRLGATRVIVLPTGMSCAIDKPPRGVLATALHALNLLIMRQLEEDAARCAQHGKVVIVPPLCPLIVTPYDFSHSGELIHRAEVSTRLWLKRGGLDGNVEWGGPLVHDHHARNLLVQKVTPSGA